MAGGWEHGAPPGDVDRRRSGRGDFVRCSALAYRVTDPRGEFGYEFEGVFHVLVLGAVGGVVGAVAANGALGLGMSIAWQVDLSALGWVLAAAGGIAGFMGGRALADRSPAERG